MNDGVPSIAEGRTDRWSFMRLAGRRVCMIREGAELDWRYYPAVPAELAAEVARVVGTDAYGVAYLRVTWDYPAPVFFDLVGNPIELGPLYDRLLAWYAGELHRGAQR